MSSAIVRSQEISVIDSLSLEPIIHVTIYNEERTKSVFTDLEGKADISTFSENEKIYFSHLAFSTSVFFKQEIEKMNFVVLLAPNPNSLDQVVLSVAKFGQKRDNVSHTVVSISSKDVVFSNPQTSADLLENNGPVYVQKSQLGGGSPMIRGFATNRLLITVDGVRMNNAIFRSGNIQNIISIDPLALEKTEIILGSGPVIYGSDAVGGVMNFYTIDPKFSHSEKTELSGNALARYATANSEKTAHFDFTIGRKKWAFVTSATYSDFDDLRMGSHGPDEYLRTYYVTQQDGLDVVVENPDPLVQKPTGYEQINLLQKVKFAPNNEWEFNFTNYFSSTSDYPRYDRLFRNDNNIFGSAEWYYGPQVWFLSNFGLNKRGNGEIYDHAKFNVSYQFFKESRHNRDFGDIIRYSNTEMVDAYSMNFDFEKDFSASKLFYGFDYVFNKVHSTGKEKNLNTNAENTAASRYPNNSTWQSMAVYANYLWEISSDLTFNMGARYNHVLLDADFNELYYDFPFQEANLSTGATTGNIGLNWKQSDFLKLKLNVSTAFRAPNIDDIGKIFDSEPGTVVVPNPNLKPEYSYSGELGVELNMKKVFRIDLTGYYTSLQDALVRRPFSLNGETTIEYQGEPSEVQAIQNAASAHVYGIEFGSEFFISEKLSLQSQLVMTEGEEELDNGSRAPMRHVGPFFGNSHLIWQNKNLKFDLYTEFNGEIAFKDLAPSEQSKDYLYAVDQNGNPYFPSWYTLNISAQVKLSDNWMFTTALENFTDQRYRTYSSGIAAAGINAIAAVKFSF